MASSTVETQSAFMATAAALVLAAAVLRGHREREALRLAPLCACFGALALGYGLPRHEGLLIASALASLGSLTPLCALAFARAQEPPAAVRIALLGIPLALSAGLWLAFPGARNPLVAGCAAWALVGVAQATRVLGTVAFAGERPAIEPPDRTRLRYLTLAHAAIPFAVLVDLACAQLSQPRLATGLASLVCLYMAYLHLEQIRIKDLGQLVGNAVGLTFMAGALTAAFTALRLWGGERVDVFVFNAFVASAVMLLFLRPLRRRIRSALDRRFVASKLALERAFAPLRERLPHILTLDELMREALETCESTGRLRAAAIFLREAPHVGFQHASSFGIPPRLRLHLLRDPLWLEALEEGQPLQREELERSLRGDPSPQVAARARIALSILEELDAQLALPLRSDAQVVGFWTLADVNPREAFSSREIDLLRDVADSMARTVESSKTFARQRAHDRLAMLGEMSAGLAHEIRNPLATISGAVALLETASSREATEIRRMIAEEIERLDRLVETFLNYARPSPEQATLDDVGAFVADCARAARGGERSGGIGADAAGRVRLEIDVEPDLPAIRCNPNHLECVIWNLIQNAYDALGKREDGRILVSVQRAPEEPGAPDAVEIEIEDNGAGMDASTLERVFIPFFTTKDTGTGLGLPLCERLVRAQGGELQLQSVPDERTCARIWLPAGRAAAEAP